LVLSFSYKDVEVVLLSKVIIMEGVVIDAIKTVGIDDRWKVLFLLKKDN
jgi:hypothetical protein